MTRLEKLYREATGEGAVVFDLELTHNFGVSAPDGYICIDRARVGSERQEAVVLAHELGHYTTGSFYADDGREHGRSETRAERAAIRRMVPFADLIAALEAGITSLWELAEKFEVTEEFMRKALGYYFEEAGIGGVG